MFKNKEKFKVGEKLKLIKREEALYFKSGSRTYSSTAHSIGDIFEIVEIEGKHFLDKKTDCWYALDCFVKLGGTMSKYDELKQRIEALDEDSTLKETDDLLQEIKSKGSWAICIEISNSHSICGYVEIQDSCRNQQVHFEYRSQCQKLTALKQALLWLLDHSDIKKDEKQQEIEVLQEEINQLQKKLDRLKK